MIKVETTPEHVSVQVVGSGEEVMRELVALLVKMHKQSPEFRQHTLLSIVEHIDVTEVPMNDPNVLKEALSKNTVGLTVLKKLMMLNNKLKTGMSIVEYLTRKNALALKYFGVIIVPEDQIVEVEKHKLSAEWNTEACPYCLVYLCENSDGCKACPMTLAGNRCSDRNSSWNKFTNGRDEVQANSQDTVDQYYKELAQLIDEFNESNGL